MKKIMSVLVFIFFFIPQTGFSLPMSEFPPSQWTKETTYVSKTIGKLGFGLVNVIGGWTGIVTEFHEQPETNIGAACFRAIGRVVTNTVGGALHAVTFPAPFDIRLPGGGTNFGD